jgi:hypothetical protein
MGFCWTGGSHEMIAADALALGATLATDNVRHFRALPNQVSRTGFVDVHLALLLESFW